MARIRVLGGDIGFELVEPEEALPSIDLEARRIDPSDAHALAIERARAATDRGPDLTNTVATIEAIVFGHPLRKPP